MNKVSQIFKGFSSREKILFGFSVFVFFGFFLYSFTQIDLSLTFSRIALLRNIVKSFQYIGYFNRPLSTYLYITLLILLFVLYFLHLYFAQRKKLGKKYVWTVVIAATVILFLAYNAFSYDLFNYIFDAKIITHYHQNPYQQKALDYPGDPMLSFMRWTHRTYPYGPVWLLLTVPLSFLGLQYFLPTFFLFKALMALSFLGSLYFVGKIFQRISPEKEIFGLVFFGLQPLLLVECLISAHLDIVMIFFSLWAVFVLIEKKYFISFLLLAISIGIKFLTGFLLPVFLFVFVLQQRKKTILWIFMFLCSIILMIITAILASNRTNFQPWYLVEVIAFTAFLGYRYYVFLPSIIFSFFALLQYVPYLFLGNWNNPVPQLLVLLQTSSIEISFLAVAIYFFVIFLRKKAKVKK